VAAKSILTILEHSDKIIPGIFDHYKFLSERCHPNGLGHYQLFGVRDRKTNIMAYSDYNQSEMHLDCVLAGAMLIDFAEPCMDRLDAAIIRVSDLHNSVAPITDKWG
jgi:hypothetical protein